MSEEELFDKIEAYILNELPSEEKAAFERQIAENPTLAQEVQMHRLEHEAMDVLVAQDTKTKMDAWATEEKLKDKRRNILWIVGVGILLVLLLLFLFRNKTLLEPQEDTLQQDTENTPLDQPIDSSEVTQQPLEIIDEQTENGSSSSSEEIQGAEEQREELPVAELSQPNQQEQTSTLKSNQYLALAETTYANTPPSDLNLRTRGSENELDEAKQAYQDGEFDKVISILENLSNKRPLIYEILGHAYLQEKRYAEATTAFETITNGDDPATARYVEFYLLLSYLAQNMQGSEKFNTLLNKLTDNERHPNNEEAIDLDKKLKALN